MWPARASALTCPAETDGPDYAGALPGPRAVTGQTGRRFAFRTRHDSPTLRTAATGTGAILKPSRAHTTRARARTGCPRDGYNAGPRRNATFAEGFVVRGMKVHPVPRTPVVTESGRPTSSASSIVRSQNDNCFSKKRTGTPYPPPERRVLSARTLGVTPRASSCPTVTHASLGARLRVAPPPPRTFDNCASFETHGTENRGPFYTAIDDIRSKPQVRRHAEFFAANTILTAVVDKTNRHSPIAARSGQERDRKI